MQHNIFKKIISIGYEFETHDIAKMTITNDGFVVSDIDMQSLNTATDNEIDEHFNDPDMDGDTVNNDILMHTTVDFAARDFDTTLLPKCQPLLNKNKNEMYALKIKKNTYPIRFGEILLNEGKCSNFSGVEWIVTYYNPPSSSSIVLSTFSDACLRITSQLDECVKYTGSFKIKQTKELVGYKYRHIYNKPNTSLYFLQRNDGLYSSVERNYFTLDKIRVVPQMTFCVNATYAMKVMEELITLHPKVKTAETIYAAESKDEFMVIYDAVVLLFPMKKTDTVQKAICLLGLILYKIIIFVNDFADIRHKEAEYLKEHLAFSVRHTNRYLYKRLKELLVELKLTRHDVLNLDVIEKLYKKHKGAVRNKISKETEGYGDPSVSLLSYFDYLETNKKDWFVDSRIDYTNTYKIKDDNLMIEYRIFGLIMSSLMVDNNIPVKSYSPNIGMLKSFTSMLIDNKRVINRTGKILNKKSHRYTKKCKDGEIRDENFVCKLNL